MRKWSIVLASGAVVVSLLTISSCKHHESPAKPKVSMGEPTMTVDESIGTIKIPVTLDKPATENFTLTYVLSGTAGEMTAVGRDQDNNQLPYDYQITSTYLQVNVKKDSTLANITLRVASDFTFETDESIILTLSSLDTDNVELATSNLETNITLKQDPGLKIDLEWEGTGVDMDLVLWVETQYAMDNSTDTTLVPIIGSANAGTTSPEELFLPAVYIYDGHYGISAVYYSGAVDPLNFDVKYTLFQDDALGTPVSKPGQYTIANVNPYGDSENGHTVLLEYQFTQHSGTFVYGDFKLPSQFSRMNPHGTSSFKRGQTPNLGNSILLRHR